jgi:hypothetical protein
VISLTIRLLLINVMVILLSLVTILLFEWVEHYLPNGEQLLANPTFEEGLAGWRSSKGVTDGRTLQTPGQLVLINESSDQSKVLSQTLPRPGRYLKLQASVDISGVRQGPEVWHKARIDLLGRDPTGQWRWDFDNTLVAELGTQVFPDISKVVDIPVDLDPVRVEIELTGATGTMRVLDIRAWPVEVRPVSLMARDITRYSWLVLIMVIFGLLVAARHYVAIAGILMLGFFVLFIPGMWKEALQSALAFNQLSSSGVIPKPYGHDLIQEINCSFSDSA